MSLRFIYGESGSGKTDFCMREAAACGRQAIIIVPEQYSHTAEKRLASLLGVFGTDGVQVQSFGQLARRLLKTSDGIALRRIDKCGKTMLLCKILIAQHDNLVFLGTREDEKAKELQRLIAEFKRYGISCERLRDVAESLDSPVLKAKISETQLIYEEYEKALSGSFIDSDDNLTRAAAILENGEFLKNTEIYLDSFSSFTPPELLCIQRFLQYASRVSMTLAMPASAEDEVQYLPLLTTRDTLLRTAKLCNASTEKSVSLSPVRKRSEAIKFIIDNYFTHSDKVFDSETDDIEIFEAGNPYTEMMHVAACIRRLCVQEGLLFRDIGIVCGDTQSYTSYAKTIFPKSEIPFFPDSKIAVQSHPVIAFVLSALEIIAQGYANEAVFRYAKSEFSGVSAEKTDLLENFVLAAGLHGNVWKSDEKWTMRTSLYSEKAELSDDEKSRLAEINLIRDELMTPLRTLAAALKEGTSAREKCACVYDFMLSISLSENAEAAAAQLDSSGDSYGAAQYRAAYNKLIDALDETVDALGDERIGIQRFYEVFSSGMSELEIGLIPALSDGVRMGDIARIKGYDVKVLFIVGANDGVFPSSVGGNGFLSDPDRNILAQNGISLAPDGKTQALESDHMLLKAFTAPSDKLFISFAGSDFEGAALREALCVSRIKELFPRVPVKDDFLTEIPDPQLAPFDIMRIKQSCAARTTVYGDKTQVADPEKLQEILGSSLTSSVSRLEKFAACPFSYFMQYTLGARERQTAQLQSSDAGSFLHNFIDIFSERLESNSRTWRDIDEEYINSETDIITQEISGRISKYILENSPSTLHSFVRLRKTLKTSVSFISKQIRLGSFEPLGYEIHFGKNGKIKPLEIQLSGGKTVALTGVIDRADILRSGEDSFVRITDYKSGKKSFNLLEAFSGVSLQLGVYLTALCENDKSGKTKPAGMLYFRLDDPIVKNEKALDAQAIEQKRIKELKISGLLTDNEAVLDAMDSSGVFDFYPVTRNMDGSLRQASKVATEKNFMDLSAHIKRTVAKLTEEIYSGKTDISPLKDTDPCEFCAYHSVCRFSGNGCRRLEKLDNTEIWERMAAENEH